MADAVSLAVNGQEFQGWKEVKITRSLKAIAAGFNLSITDSFTKNNKPWIIRPGEACVLKIDGETVVAGYVDALNLSLSSTDRSITVDGRERTSDLVDCCVDAAQFNNITLEGMAKKFAEPFSITVLNQAGTSKVFPFIGVNPGQTCFAVLEHYAKREAVLLSSTGRGTLLITKVGALSSSAVLEEGVNILSCSASFDNKARFRDYIVRAQNNYADMDATLQRASEGRSKDSGISRQRLLIVHAETAVDREEAQKRANWELVTRQAKAWTVSVKVQGWRRSDGKLWAPNTLIRVKAPSIAVDANLLISDVTFTQSISGGTVTDLKLTRKDAYQPEPEKPDEAELLRKLVVNNQVTR